MREFIRVNTGMVKHGEMMDKQDIVDLLGVEVLGLVPADDRTITAANRGVPVVHDKKASSGAAFVRIAARIDGEEVPLPDLDSKAGLVDRLKGIMGLNGRAYSHA